MKFIKMQLRAICVGFSGIFGLNTKIDFTYLSHIQVPIFYF